MTFRIITAIALISIFASCGNTKNNKLIIGKWIGAEWLVNGSPSDRNPRETHFTFDDQGNYTFTYGGVLEKGTYVVENEMLFTKPADHQEIMVRISKLSKDSLIFDMNRSGQPETLVLIKAP
jgi:hypothetical protein